MHENAMEHAGQGIEMRDPGEKNRAANGKIPKTAISIRTRYFKTIPYLKKQNF
jgi:hypothetical protein